MNGKCVACGQNIDSDKDKLCLDNTGHITTKPDKNGEPYSEPCGPIDWEGDRAERYIKMFDNIMDRELFFIRYGADIMELLEDVINKLKKCREQRNGAIARGQQIMSETDLRIRELTWDKEKIEQRTKEACFRVVWDYLTPQVWFMGNDQNYFKKEIRQIIDEAKTIS